MHCCAVVHGDLDSTAPYHGSESLERFEDGKKFEEVDDGSSHVQTMWLVSLYGGSGAPFCHAGICNYETGRM